MLLPHPGHSGRIEGMAAIGLHAGRLQVDPAGHGGAEIVMGQMGAVGAALAQQDVLDPDQRTHAAGGQRVRQARERWRVPAWRSTRRAVDEQVGYVDIGLRLRP